MNQKLVEVLQTNPRMRDYYQIGPVQKAAVEDLMYNVIAAVLVEVRDEVHGHDWELSYIVRDRVLEAFGVTP
jgi:hypothetical protein